MALNLPFLGRPHGFNLRLGQAAVVQAWLQKIAHLGFSASGQATASVAYGLYMMRWQMEYSGLPRPGYPCAGLCVGCTPGITASVILQPRNSCHAQPGQFPHKLPCLACHASTCSYSGSTSKGWDGVSQQQTLRNSCHTMVSFMRSLVLIHQLGYLCFRVHEFPEAAGLCASWPGQVL